MDSLDALFLISVIDDQNTVLAHEADHVCLDDLADELHDGRLAPLTVEEQDRLCRCA